jgi:hypothetical protein
MKHKFICMYELTSSLTCLRNFFVLGTRKQVFFTSVKEVQKGTCKGEEKEDRIIRMGKIK